MKTLRVSNSSKAYSVATSIAENIKTDGIIQVVSIGAASTYEATKAMIHAKGLLASVGLRMICIPSFIDVEIDGGKGSEEEGTVIPMPNAINEELATGIGETKTDDNVVVPKKIRTAVKWIIKAVPEEY